MEDNGTSQSAYERNCSFSANCSQNDDFFHFAFSDSSAVAAALISWCCVQAVAYQFQFIGLPLLFGLVAYEQYGSFNYRTLINSLHCYGYTLMVIYCLSGFNILIIRVLFGPLPGPVCSFEILQKRGFILGVLLSATESFVLRYLYSCVWRNVGFLNDEFFRTFLVSLNSFFSFIFVILNITIWDHQAGSFNYAVCTGQNPILSLERKKFDVLIAIFLACALLCLALNALTHLQQPRALTPGAPLPPPTANHASVASLFELSKVFECLAISLIPVSFVPNIVCKSAVRQNLVKNVLPVLVTGSLFAPYLACQFLLPMAMYASRPRLRRHIAIEIRDSPAGRCIHCLADGILHWWIRLAAQSPPPPSPPPALQPRRQSNSCGGETEDPRKARMTQGGPPKLAWEKAVEGHGNSKRPSLEQVPRREGQSLLSQVKEDCEIVDVESIE